MRKTMTLWAILAMAILPLFSQEPFSSKSALVMQNGKAFTGQAEFKFLIHSDSTVLWSNDGSCKTLVEPQKHISLMVTDGVYDVELGTRPMRPIFTDLLALYKNATIRTWVNTGNGFQMLGDMPYSNSLVVETNQPNQDHLMDSIPPLLVGLVKKKNKQVEDQKADNPEGWVKQWRLQHEDADGKIPFDGLSKAKRHIDAMPQPKDAGIWNWSWLGPGNIGGRIRAIAIKPTDENRIFVGSVGGGILKSTNGGSSWSVVNDFLPSLAVTTILYDPTNLNTMYCSTGEGFYNSDAIPGAGIFKSTDGGTTWNQLEATNDTNFRWVNRLAHHPDSSGVLYAVTRSPNLLWKTSDGGVTWDSLFRGPYHLTDVKVSPHHPQTVIIGSQYGAYRSNDYGITWDTLTNDAPNKLPRNCYRCEISFCEDNENRVYLTMERNWGMIFRSEDLGNTWTQQNVDYYNYLGIDKSQGWYNQAIWVDPTNSDNIVVGGIDLWKSTDGGATLAKISRWEDYHNGGLANSAHADQHIIVSSPAYNGTTNKKVFFGNDGGIQKTNDVTTVSENSGWVNLAGSTLGITQFYGGAASSDGSVIIGGAQDNDKIRYHSLGDWSGAGSWFQAEYGDGGMCAVDPTNSDILYSEYVFLRIKKSIDGGDTWSTKTSNLSDANDGDKSLFIAPFVIDPNNPQTLIAGGTSIWRTTDAAENWGSIKNVVANQPKCSAIDVAPGNSDIIYVGYTNGRLEVTFNGTAANPTWTRIDNNAVALPNRYVTDIAINPTNSNEVYVTFSGFNNDNIWYSSDNGQHWICRSGSAPNDLPALQVNSIRVHPRNGNWVFAGTDLGVFASMDKGQNWAIDPRYPTQNNEMPANVCVSELFWQDDYNLIAASHGRGMYRALTMPVIYVDQLAAPGGNGSPEAPFQTVTEAVNAAGNGTTISIKSNTYNEPPLNFSKKGRVKSTNGATRIK